MALDDFEDKAGDPLDEELDALDGFEGLLDDDADLDLDQQAEDIAAAAKHDDPLGFDELGDDAFELTAELPEFDEEDDLFDFDEIVRASLEDSNFYAGIEDLLDDEEQPAVEETPTPEAAAPEPSVDVGTQLPTEKLLAAPSSGGKGRYVWQEGKGPARLSGTAVMLAFVAVCNLALVGVAWRSLGTVETAVSEVGLRLGEQVLAQAAIQRPDPGATPVSRPVDAWRPIEVDEKPEGYQAIELARVDMEQGAFARARRRLYSLLSILDRVEASERADVEAHARLLVADCWRAEAEGLERGAR